MTSSARNESQIETYFDSVCIFKGFMVLYAIDHSVLRVRYKKQAGDKPSACFLFIILQSVY